jgi:histidinol phosphatase-like enzyme/mannose-6-phosphate isomerase-like protein (cupin superfamily)
MDIDGVIRYNNASKRGSPYYVLDYGQVEYIEGIFPAHKLLQDAGYKIFWVTMQNCIKFGEIPEQEVQDVLVKMVADFKHEDIIITDFQICQSKEETDESKSQAKCEAIQKLAMVYNIDLSKSIGVGDRRHDINAYDMAGIDKTIQALLPYGDSLHPNAYDFYSLEMGSVDTLKNIVANVGRNFTTMAHTNPNKVEKVWGNEYWIVNSKEGNYCSKILELKEGHKSSLHYHNNKHETFVVLSGIVHINHGEVLHRCIAGDRVEIAPNEKHFFESLYGDAYILEVSTYHEDEDCVRLEPSR